MESTFVCIKTSWSRGYARCSIAAVLSPNNRPPEGACLHEIPSSALPLSDMTRKRICRDHVSSGLGFSTFRCRADATPRFHRRLRDRDLPVRVVTDPPYLLQNPVGSSLSISLADIMTQLQRALPGEWTLRGWNDSGKALAVSHCALKDVGGALPPPPPGAAAWHLRATLEGESKSTEQADLGRARKRRRVEKLASIVDPRSGAYDAERLVAQRLLQREVQREVQRRGTPLPHDKQS